jgi:hypothetical protein
VPVALSRRFHILLDENRVAALQARATAKGISIGRVIRDAIDQSLEEEDPRRSAAAAFLTAPPVRVGTPEELDREIEPA